jgi:hypothetical protein
MHSSEVAGMGPDETTDSWEGVESFLFQSFLFLSSQYSELLWDPWLQVTSAPPPLPPSFSTTSWAEPMPRTCR